MSHFVQLMCYQFLYSHEKFLSEIMVAYLFNKITENKMVKWELSSTGKRITVWSIPFDIVNKKKNEIKALVVLDWKILKLQMYFAF